MVRTMIESRCPFFIVSHVDRTIAFYTYKLGFETSYKEPDEEPFFATISRDGASLFVKAGEASPHPRRAGCRIYRARRAIQQPAQGHDGWPARLRDHRPRRLLALLRASERDGVVWAKLVSSGLIIQVEKSPLLALHATDRTIGSFPVGLSVQRYPDGKSARRLVPDDLNGANGLAPGPLSDGLQALLSQSAVT